jgi:hypothetical protein
MATLTLGVAMVDSGILQTVEAHGTRLREVTDGRLRKRQEAGKHRWTKTLVAS